MKVFDLQSFFRSPAATTSNRQSRGILQSVGSRSRSPSPQSSTSSSDLIFKSAAVSSTVKTKLQLVDLAGSECVGMLIL